MNYQNYILDKSRILKRVQDTLIKRPGITDREVMVIIEEAIIEDADCRKYSMAILNKMRRDLFNRIRRLDVISDLLDDDSITEIMVNGTDNIFVERNGRLVDSGLQFESKDRIFDVAGQIASKVNRRAECNS